MTRNMRNAGDLMDGEEPPNSGHLHLIYIARIHCVSLQHDPRLP